MCDQHTIGVSNLPVPDISTPNHILSSMPDLEFSSSPLLYRGKRIAVVVPAYNEEPFVKETLTTIPPFVEKIYVIDDASTDNTLSIIQDCAKKDSRVVPIHHEQNSGVGKSITTGFKRALNDHIDIIAVMAGDNQMDPIYLPELLNPIIEKKCDFAKGNRLKVEYWKGMPPWRLSGNLLLTMLNKIASGYWFINDPQNGYVAISAQALNSIDLNNLYPRFAFENDLMIKANIVNIKIYNVDIPAKYGNEKSKINYLNFIYTLSGFLLRSFIFRIWRKSKQSTNPVYALYFSGIILLIIGIPLIFFNAGVVFIIGIILFILACIYEALQDNLSHIVRE